MVPTKNRLFAASLKTITTVVWLFSLPQAVHAFSLNGWDYAVAPFNNGVTFEQVGGGTYEFHSIAIKDTPDKLTIAFNANLPLSGSTSITWGDLFFNFTGNSFKSASDSDLLYGVRFASVGSDSGVPALGVYRNVTAKSVALSNSGFANLTEYSDRVGGNNSFGDLTSADAYFEGQQTGNGTVLNSIASGKKVADITLLTADLLATEGLDFSYFGATGSQTFGLVFDKPEGFQGTFIANVFAECANDGLVIQSEAVPEPITVAGIAIALSGLSLLRNQTKNRKPSLKDS